MQCLRSAMIMALIQKMCVSFVSNPIQQKIEGEAIRLNLIPGKTNELNFD